MSCISSNFSSFFLNSLNDPSEFAKYLSNGELKFSSFEDFQAFGTGTQQPTQQQQQQFQLQQHQQQQQQHLNGNITYYNHSNGSNINSTNNNSNSNGIGGGVVVGATGGSGAINSAGVHNNAEMFNGGGGIIGANANMETTNNFTHPGAATASSVALHPQQITPQHLHHPLHHHPHPTSSHHTPQQHYAQTPNAFHHNHTAHHSLNVNNTPTNTTQGYTPPQQQRWPPIVTTSGTPHANAAAAAAAALHSAHASAGTSIAHTAAGVGAQHFDGSFEFLKYLRHSNEFSASDASENANGAMAATAPGAITTTQAPNTNHMTISNHQQQQQQATASLIDLDSSTTHKSPKSSRKVAALLSSVSRASNSLDSTSALVDVFDHDSKHTMFDLHHMTTTNSSNSNESSLLEVSNLAFPSSHLNASNSNTSSEGATAGSSDFSMLNSNSSNAPKPLANFIIKDNFDVHSSHKVEEGIFQHMNKLPPKKKENLKQLGVRFTGQMTLSDKSIVVENFIKFCQEYDIKDHRPFLSLNQSGLNKPDQIKFARYLGQGLATFTLFCIYSNFKNLFCTKRTEIYTKDGYNLPYILDKTKRFLSNTTADLKNMVHQQSNDGLDFSTSNNNNSNINNNNNNNSNNTPPNINSTSTEPNALAKCIMPKVLENFVIYENFDVHETHRVEDGVCTHITRLPPKKQEIFKQFGIQSNQSVTYYEKYTIIENFIRFSNEYKITDHRPFLDFHESGLPKSEQVKFVRYLGQGLPNLTLNKIYLAFKDVLGINRIEKITIDGYNLDMILKKKKKNLYNRMHAAVHRESTKAARQAHCEIMNRSLATS